MLGLRGDFASACNCLIPLIYTYSPNPVNVDAPRRRQGRQSVAISASLGGGEGRAGIRVCWGARIEELEEDMVDVLGC